MPEYVYVARNHLAEKVSGSIFSESRQSAVDALSAKDIYVVEIKESAGGYRLARKVSMDSIWAFNQKLIALTRAGLPVVDALKVITATTRSQQLLNILQAIIKSIEDGVSFPKAASSYPEVFDKLFLAALMTAEKTGDLSAALQNYQTFLENKIRTWKKISNAFVYPVFLLITLVGIVGILFAFVLPRFVTLYADMKAQLPLPTQMLIGMVHHLPFVLLGVGGLIAIALWVRRRLSLVARIRLNEFMLSRVPVVSGILSAANAAYISRSLASMLLSGATVPEALQTSADASRSPALSARVDVIIQAVEQGEALSVAFQRAGIFPDIGNELVAIGEETGQLPSLLLEIAQFYDAQLDGKLSRLTALVEPVLMLLIGLFVGGIIITMYLPIFSLAEIVR